jgi:hypothetical protein
MATVGIIIWIIVCALLSEAGDYQREARRLAALREANRNPLGEPDDY